MCSGSSSFDSTYEGLKPAMSSAVASSSHCFDSTYEGLKPLSM